MSTRAKRERQRPHRVHSCHPTNHIPTMIFKKNVQKRLLESNKASTPAECKFVWVAGGAWVDNTHQYDCNSRNVWWRKSRRRASKKKLPPAQFPALLPFCRCDTCNIFYLVLFFKNFPSTLIIWWNLHELDHDPNFALQKYSFTAAY